MLGEDSKTHTFRSAVMRFPEEIRGENPNFDWVLALLKGKLQMQQQERAVISKAAAGKAAASIDGAGNSGIGKAAASVDGAGNSAIGKAAASVDGAGNTVIRKAEIGRDTRGKREEEKTEKLLQERSMAAREQKRRLQEKQRYAAILGNIDHYRSLPQSFESGRIPAADAQKLACHKWQPMQFPKNNVQRGMQFTSAVN